MRAFIILLLFARPAPAPPPPREGDADVIRRNWGTVVDPNKDCTVKLAGPRLVVQVPHVPHVYSTTDRIFHAPRVLRDYEGDFEATVVVHPGNLPLKAKEKDGYTPTACAGILMTDAEGKYQSFVAVERLVSREHKRVLTFGLSTIHPPDGRQSGSTCRDVDQPDGPVHLKMTRAGSLLCTAVSFNGKTWHEFDEMKVDWPDAVKIGVFVAHDTDQPFEAGFENLKVEKPVKK